ncbi:MAG: hypothetical protein Q9208_002116 [Pyrenodesmia sp. 3 TL-2023]
MDTSSWRQAKRARATRRVVNSSPTIEASTSRSSLSERVTRDTGLYSQDDQSLDREPADEASTSRSSSSESVTRDTRLYSQDNRSPDRESGTSDSQKPSVLLEVPLELLAREVDVGGSSDITLSPLHDRYARFLQTLCDETDTADLKDFCLGAYPHMIKKGCTKAFDKSFENTKIDRYALAFVVFTWLFVCSRYFHGQNPIKGEYLHQRWASYFRSAFEILRCYGYLPAVHDTDEDSTSMLSEDEGDSWELQHLAFAMTYWEDRFFGMAEVRPWASERWLLLVAQTEPDRTYFRNEIAKEYVGSYGKDGVPGLRKLLLSQEKDMPQSPLRSLPDTVEKKDELVRNLDLILASIDERLLEAIINGQVARQAQDPRSALSSRLKRMQKSPEEQPPSIYINTLCDEEGISPTPYQWRAICELMDLYIQCGEESDSLAVCVDQLIYPTDKWPPSRRGPLRKLRRYAEFETWTQNESDLVCTHRRRTIADFVANMRFRLESEEKLEHKPLTAPVIEVGFSDKVYERLSQHRRHQSSNYIMNLAQALFEYSYPGMFHLHQHVIYHCWREFQPWYAEILLSRLAQGYIDNAGGFSHHNAGMSNGSSFRKRSAKEWELFQKMACADDGFKERLEMLEKSLERQKELDSKDEEVERIKAMTALMVATRKVMLLNLGSRPPS